MNDLYGEIIENFVSEEGIIDEEGLRQWFKKGGWRQAGGKYDGKPCARQPGQKTTPKCVSRKKYSSMSKKERDSAGRRKRRKDPGQTKKRGAAKPTYVKTDPQKGGRKKKKKSKKNEELYMNFEQLIQEELEAVLDEKQKKKKKKAKRDACYHKVKSRYKVWPSAYASGALVKCRKVGAKNWGNSKKESIEIEVQNEIELVLQESTLNEKKKKKKSAKDRMKCNSSRRIRKGEAGYGKKKFVVKACEGGTEKIIRYGDANMEIKKDSPARRKSFRARHNCKNPGSKLKARYWSCKKW